MKLFPLAMQLYIADAIIYLFVSMLMKKNKEYFVLLVLCLLLVNQLRAQPKLGRIASLGVTGDTADVQTETQTGIALIGRY
jgi:hypothetical protein